MALTISTASRPHPGEQECGDQYGHWQCAGKVVLALADGLGHGPEAAHAARLALQTIAQAPHLNCEQQFEACNEALTSTRGVALSIAIVDTIKNRIEVASVGNIRTRLLGEVKDFHFGGARGIVGAGYKNLLPETATIRDQELIVLFSDGMEELANIRQLLPKGGTTEEIQHSALELVKTFGRHDDDVSALVYQHNTAVPGQSSP